MEPVVKKIKILDAQYIKEADSIAILGECSDGILRHQIHKSSFSFGNRSEKEIDYEMEKTAHMFIGKTIDFAFDPELELKIECRQPLKYKKGE